MFKCQGFSYQLLSPSCSFLNWTVHTELLRLLSVQNFSGKVDQSLKARTHSTSCCHYQSNFFCEDKQYTGGLGYMTWISLVTWMVKAVFFTIRFETSHSSWLTDFQVMKWWESLHEWIAPCIILNVCKEKIISVTFIIFFYILCDYLNSFIFAYIPFTILHD